MINKVSFRSAIEQQNRRTDFVVLPFYKNGIPLDSDYEFHARWGMSLLSAGNMRFRLNETNKNRELFFSSVLSREKNKEKTFVSVELLHSKIVFDIHSVFDFKNLNLKGDGIITKNKDLIPTVTVADCVPIFLYDFQIGVFGICHSGWKGTGIIKEAINLMQKNYGSCPENICVALGPHINQCCYDIDDERAAFFRKNFGNCVSQTRNEQGKNINKLSLTDANLFLLRDCGIPEENIVAATDCTCCAGFENKPIFGSFRRESSELPAETPFAVKSKKMTAQLAFVISE